MCVCVPFVPQAPNYISTQTLVKGPAILTRVSEKHVCVRVCVCVRPVMRLESHACVHVHVHAIYSTCTCTMIIIV